MFELISNNICSRNDFLDMIKIIITRCKPTRVNEACGVCVAWPTKELPYSDSKRKLLP